MRYRRASRPDRRHPGADERRGAERAAGAADRLLEQHEADLRDRQRQADPDREQRRAAEQLRYAARHDDLTGLPNRSFLMHKLHDRLGTADVEVIPIQKVNEAYERMLESDVKYRFSIDMASLKNE